MIRSAGKSQLTHKAKNKQTWLNEKNTVSLVAFLINGIFFS